MNHAPLVAVIIVNWNRRELLNAAMASLAQDGYSNIRTIVIDNGSTDGSVELIKASFPNVIIIENSQNLGYSQGNNQGIETAHSIGAEFLFFLNNDATLKPGCLRELVSLFAAHPRCGAASPFIVYADKPEIIWFGGGEVSLWSGQVRHKHIRQRFDLNYYAVETTEYISGCALMIRSLALKDVGGFDERYALYSEDVDLCLSLRRAGWELRVTPKAIAAHRISSSTGGELSPVKAFYRARSTAILIKRWAPLWAWAALPFAGLIGLLIVSAGLIIKGHLPTTFALWRGLASGFMGSNIPKKFRLDFAS